MTAEELYAQLKHFLNFAGLRFSEMDKVAVSIENGKLTFRCGGYSYMFENSLELPL